MATEFWYRESGGTYRKAKQVHYKASGTWRTAKQVWYRSGGTWRLVFAGNTIISPSPLTNQTDNHNTLSPANASAQIVLSIKRDGTFLYDKLRGSDVSGDWVDGKHSTVGDAFEARATVTSGALTSNGMSSYSALSSDRSITVTAVNNADSNSTVTVTATVTIDIREIANPSNIVSKSIVVTAVAQVET